MVVLNEHSIDWINKRSLLLAKSINETTLKALREIIKIGYEQGESIATITKRIADYFPESEKYRAEAIARTETLTANNEGSIQRYKDEGVKEFEWLASPDACEECQPLDGQVFPIDSDTKPPYHVNCRCTILSVEK
jgi:SPP1 gp7 family putative phage head morphogenesis protein